MTSFKLNDDGSVTIPFAEFSRLAAAAAPAQSDETGAPALTVSPLTKVSLTDKTRRHLFGAIRDFAQRATNDREFRLAWASAQLQRRITTFSQLSEFEGQMLVSAIEDYTV